MALRISLALIAGGYFPVGDSMDLISASMLLQVWAETGLYVGSILVRASGFCKGLNTSSSITFAEFSRSREHLDARCVVSFRLASRYPERRCDRHIPILPRAMLDVGQLSRQCPGCSFSFVHVSVTTHLHRTLV